MLLEVGDTVVSKSFGTGVVESLTTGSDNFPVRILCGMCSITATLTGQFDVVSDESVDFVKIGD